MAARPSTHKGVHSSNSPMVAQFEGPVRGPVRRSVTPVVAHADADGFTVVKRKRTVTKPKAVIGTKCATTLKAKAGRFTAVFVSRLDPDTTEDDMERYVRETHNLSLMALVSCSSMSTIGMRVQSAVGACDAISLANLFCCLARLDPPSRRESTRRIGTFSSRGGIYTQTDVASLEMMLFLNYSSVVIQS